MVDIHRIPKEKREIANPIVVGPDHGEEDKWIMLICATIKTNFPPVRFGIIFFFLIYITAQTLWCVNRERGEKANRSQNLKHVPGEQRWTNSLGADLLQRYLHVWSPCGWESFLSSACIGPGINISGLDLEAPHDRVIVTWNQSSILLRPVRLWFWERIAEEQAWVLGTHSKRRACTCVVCVRNMARVFGVFVMS